MKSRLAAGALIAMLMPMAHAQKMEIWSVDPLIKVFRDAEPARGGTIVAEAARGEHVSLQVVVRSASEISGLKAEVTPFSIRGGGEPLKAIAPRFVGYVPVDRPIQKPPKDELRMPPADYPDPLLEVEQIDVAANQVQPIWVTVKVPVDAKPGVYRAELRVDGTTDGKPVKAKERLAIRVYPVTVEKTRLKVTDWFGVNALHLDVKLEGNDDEYFNLLGRFARNMAEHRHNVALISPLSLATFSASADGKLQADWTRFDRFVDVCIDAGLVGTIEGGHIGGRVGDWSSQFGVTIVGVQDGKAVMKSADPASPEADAFYAWYFPALIAHLKEKGWLDRYIQHLADEPIPSNVESWKAIAALVRKYAPELRTIDACHTKELVGSMDIWVPQLNYLHQDFAHYQERQKAGDEVWFYTCVYPQGEYANRFIEQPLIKTRLLHWINFKYGITGYLHWGYNHWRAESPYTSTTVAHGGPPYLPAGDPWIVYPGKNGPWDSIRWEAMRDGIVDHELLSMLAEEQSRSMKRIKEKDTVQTLASSFVLDFDKYNTDVQQFRKARRELLKQLSAYQK
ncbi:MAG: DUF4091 domain-containing protein [Candidatus Hydrogenedentes bacterium]|nr:DUF4091 domain-containing protein [Candidatus Hydrogenedentota bacterium]